jgi:FlaA1/EpsC-like NDP-sugar epimerase
VSALVAVAADAASSIVRSVLEHVSRLRGARRVLLLLPAHGALIVLSSYFAFSLRFDGTIPSELLVTFVATLPWALLIRLGMFVPFGLYSGLWRYTGVWDLGRIVAAVFTSSAMLQVLVYGELGPGRYPRSIVIIDSMLLVCLLGGVRLLWRVLPGAVRRHGGRRVLIVGAGDAAEMIVREMRKGSAYLPVGFVDDDIAKVGRTIHGVTVHGTADDLPRVLRSTCPVEVLVAIPSANAATMRGLVRRLEPFKLPITTLPSLDQLVNGKVGVKQIRPLAVEDLLPRAQVSLNPGEARGFIRGKRVLVTGAGGSIGAELCRQIAGLEPESLVLFERYENSLYAIANDLADGCAGCVIQTVIGDVTDRNRVNAVFQECRPHVVFHAAAHKHVPLMEANPCEAVKNNVGGTQTIAEAARRHHVQLFVLISTDKAANPSSVMGATKRVAELIAQAISRSGGTRFVTVRFGNVLGSNGSVIPRMLDQIRAGRPVTVTHPEIRRYFMLIPEAVQLVLRAALLARGQETFVLDMGEQIRIVDVARNLIRLCGFVPDREIPIEFIGLRPGEKLMEELVGDGETLEPAGADKIFRVPWSSAPPPDLEGRIRTLVQLAAEGRAEEVVDQLQRVLPTFKPQRAATSPVTTAPVHAALRPQAGAPFIPAPASAAGRRMHIVPSGARVVE